MHRIQIALCYGTRPQIIKASVLRSRLEDTWPRTAYGAGAAAERILTAIEPLVR